MTNYDADVIVIGSGSLGGFVALQIARAGKSVIILESGPEVPDWKVTDNYHRSPRKSNWNDPFGGAIPYAPNSYTPGYIKADIGEVGQIPGTVRSVGGTSRHWTGATWRLLPEDMQLKSTFGIGQDWPFTYDELEKWYTEAEYAIGVNGDNDADLSGQGLGHTYPPRSKPYPLPPEGKPYLVQKLGLLYSKAGYRTEHGPNCRISQPYAGRPACIGNNLCQPNCPIGAKHSGVHVVAQALAAGAQLRSNATVDKLTVGGGKKITSVSYLSPDGQRSTLTAKRIVIAAHAYETPKLLLMNELANSSGQVGRNLMFHPVLNMDFYAKDPVWTGRGQFLHGSIMQRRNQKNRGSVPSARLDYENVNPLVAITEEVLKEKRFIGKAFDDEIEHRASRYVAMQMLSEDLPDPSNTISLNPNFKDALGLPGIRMRYRLSDYSRAVLPQMMGDYINWVQVAEGKPRTLPGAWSAEHHLMGTTIMGKDATTAVVDPDLRTYDHDNLFLVTTGVMPSASSVNPTLTGMALAIRAGQTIAAEV